MPDGGSGGDDARGHELQWLRRVCVGISVHVHIYVSTYYDAQERLVCFGIIAINVSILTLFPFPFFPLGFPNLE